MSRELKMVIVAGVLIVAFAAGFGLRQLIAPPWARSAPTPATPNPTLEVEVATAVQGRIVYEGEPPERQAIDVSSYPACGTTDTGPTDDAIFVNQNGTLRNVVVHVAAETVKDLTPKSAVVLEQKGCRFLPRVQAVAVGTAVELANRDAVSHTLRFDNGSAVSTRVVSAEETGVELPVPERGVLRIACEDHAWESAYVVVVPHAHFDVTGPDGTYRIAGLSAGPHQLEAWHEALGARNDTATLSGPEPAVVNFTFVTPENP